MTQDETPYTLYRRSKSGSYYVRFSITGQGQHRASLGTTDIVEAEKRAYRKYIEAQAMDNAGLSITQKQFAKVAEEFIESLDLMVERGEREPHYAKQYSGIIRRYLIPYFEKRAISAIRQEHIEDYWPWRKDFWISGPGSQNPTIRYTRKINNRETTIFRPVKESTPSASTLNKEALIMRQLFDFAKRRGYKRDALVIEAPANHKRKTNSRPSFTFDEFKKLVRVSEARIKEVEKREGNKARNERVYYDRMKLHSFVMIAAMTGMRPTELFNLNWQDIGARKVPLSAGGYVENTIIQAHGKGKSRELVALPETIVWLQILENLFSIKAGREAQPDDPVFFNNEGKRIRSFKKGLAELLVAADLRYSNDGRMRDSFSFRHFYISEQLRKGVDHHLLGRNVGTSTEMIDRYYSKVRPTDEISSLIPSWGIGKRFDYK